MTNSRGRWYVLVIGHFFIGHSAVVIRTFVICCPAMSMPRKIVLTGGPGAGKSVITRAICDAFPDRYVRVPEAATATYARLNTRWDWLDTDGQRRVQRLIYHQQIEQEAEFARLHPSDTLLLDRGTLDGAAYWPDGADAYWHDLGTTSLRELARYDAVIWLETAAALGIYDGSASNAVRFEDAPGAVASGQALLQLWVQHPKLYRVSAYTELSDKIAGVQHALRKLEANN